MTHYTQAAFWGVGLSFPIFGFLLVCLRFWVRKYFQKTKIWLDDWLILFASIIVLGMGANGIIGTYLGTMGMDGQPEDFSRLPTQKKIDYAAVVFEKPAFGAVKLSVLFFFRRIFTVDPTFRKINNFLIVLIIAWTIAFFLVDILNCGAHPRANWDPKLEKTVQCINIYIALLIFAVSDVVTDMAILSLPYPQIKKLQMRTREKWALAGVFLLGTLDLLIAIVRMSFIILNQTIPAVNTHFNPPESSAPTFWTVTELGVGVIAANLPALAPLIKQRARLATSISTFRERHMSKSGRSTAPNESASYLPEKDLYNTSSGEDMAAPSIPPSASVGLWDQYDRAEALSAEEIERRHDLA